jgi:hypothetical protein
VSEARRVPIGFVVLVAVMGIVMFLVPSAYAAARGAPVWLSATLGGLAFPVLPLAWQIFGERRRRARMAAAKAPAKGVLTRGDRFVFRCLTVALVAVVPVFALGGKSALSSVWHNVGWFIPTTPPEPAAPVLGRVPADAELVFTFHKDADKKDADKKDDDEEHKAHKRSGPVDGVLAYGGGEVVIAATGDLDDGESVGKELDEINNQRDKFPLKIGKLTDVKSSSSEVILATEAWRTKVDPAGLGPNADIRRELGRAPANAAAVVALVPRTTRELMVIKSGAAWLVITDEMIKVEGRVEAVDAASAGKALDAVRAMWKEQSRKIPDDCEKEIDKVVDRVHLDQNGAIVTLHAEIPGEVAGGAVMCAMMSAMKK